MFETDFSEHNKIREGTKDLGALPPRVCGPEQNVARKSSTGGFVFVQGGRTFWKFKFNSQAQHLQIVQIKYKYFPANSHNRLVVLKILNELKKWIGS